MNINKRALSVSTSQPLLPTNTIGSGLSHALDSWLDDLLAQAGVMNRLKENEQRQGLTNGFFAGRCQQIGLTINMVRFIRKSNNA